MRRGRALALLLAVLGCGPLASRGAAPERIVDRDWELVALGENPAPRGAGGRAPTLRLDAASGHAAGFAGCNRYTAAYTLAGERLTFAQAVSTRMACPEGMDVERTFLAMLPTVSAYQATGSALVLLDPHGPLARFTAPGPR